MSHDRWTKKLLDWIASWRLKRGRPNRSWKEDLVEKGWEGGNETCKVVVGTTDALVCSIWGNTVDLEDLQLIDGDSYNVCCPSCLGFLKFPKDVPMFSRCSILLGNIRKHFFSKFVLFFSFCNKTKRESLKLWWGWKRWVSKVWKNDGEPAMEENDLRNKQKRTLGYETHALYRIRWMSRIAFSVPFLK